MFIESLQTELDINGIALPCGAAERLANFYALQSEAAGHMNLTAIKGDEPAARLNFADSLLPMALFAGKSVIDVGTGAGFPGIPLAISTDARVTLLEATRKKADFLSDAIKALALDLPIINARAEDAARDKSHREQYDIATARAVASIRVLAELLLPFVKCGGQAILYKGPRAREELAEAENALHLLGGEVEDIREYSLSGTETRYAVIIRKARPCHPMYPRKPGIPAKKPL